MPSVMAQSMEQPKVAKAIRTGRRQMRLAASSIVHFAAPVTNKATVMFNSLQSLLH
jgi:hypothetical protein